MHGVGDALSTEGIDEGGGVADQHPAGARQRPALAPAWQLPATEAAIHFARTGEPITQPRVCGEHLIGPLAQIDLCTALATLHRRLDQFRRRRWPAGAHRKDPEVSR